MKRKLWMGLLSVLIAFGLWMYVVSVVAPESKRTYFDIPVKLHGEEVLKSRGLMLVSDQKIFLDLELSGNRTDLLQLSNSNITVIADLSGITTAGEHTVRYSVSYPGSISSGITIASPEMQTVTVKVVEYAQKEIPITVEYIGQPAEGHFVKDDTLTMDRKVVTVSGAKEEVDRITDAVVTVDLSGRLENIDQSFALTFRDADGEEVKLVNATADASSVTVVQKIHATKIISIELRIMPGGGLTEADVECRLLIDRLEISGSAADVAGQGNIILPIYIGTIDKSGTVLIDITKALNDGITNESGITQVPVEVQLPEKITKQLTVTLTPECFAGIPDGMEPSIINGEEITLLFKGREHFLEEITEQNVRIRIDLSGNSEGTVICTVEIYVDGVDFMDYVEASCMSNVKVDLIPAG